MTAYTVMAYNIEHMNRMFDKGVISQKKDKDRAKMIASVIKEINPHILGISEAANDIAEHNHFISTYLPGLGYKVAMGASRGAQNLVFYYREPFIAKSTDAEVEFYEPWQLDLDDDKVVERFVWDRKPLEVLFQIGDDGPKLMAILVHSKSKGVFSVVDFANFQKISLGNRKRLVAQALKLRERLDQIISPENPDPLPVIVMGDMNDGPGLDAFESIVGKSFVETVVGSVFEPDGIFHNVLWHMTGTSKTRKDLWTAEFPDPIVNNPLGWEHRIWIDHILVSPSMLENDSPVKYVMDSGKIGDKNLDSYKASDHFPVHCDIETN
jgi:hypothetical protein